MSQHIEAGPLRYQHQLYQIRKNGTKNELPVSSCLLLVQLVQKTRAHIPLETKPHEPFPDPNLCT